MKPVQKFYIAEGSYEKGACVNFQELSLDAAVCDASSGETNFNVVFEHDGSWTVNGVC
jgi:hypothetical protein